MIINGVWRANITCPHCRFRHPPDLTCQQASEIANQSKREPVPCGLCGIPTTNFGTERCDRCWELELRIRMDPELARQILENLS